MVSIEKHDKIVKNILFADISDPSIAEISIKDNGSEMVGLDPNNFRIVATNDRRFINGIATYPPLMRAPIYDRLNSALSYLPGNIGIAVFEGYRPPRVQKAYFNKKIDELRKENNSLSDEDIINEASKWVANPDGDLVTPHSTGAAVDVQLYKIINDDKGKCFSFLDVGKFGTIFGENPHPKTLRSENNKMTDEQWTNRKLLLTSMTKAGFVNYGNEHWHFSYGDQAACYVLREQDVEMGYVAEFGKYESNIKVPSVELDVSIKNGIDAENIKVACDMLQKTYWGYRRPLDRFTIAVNHSLCYSASVMEDNKEKMVGFGRIITDYATYAYLTDIIVDEDKRHKGIGSALINSMKNDSRIKGCYGSLSTSDAGEFYREFGFNVDNTFSSRIL